MADPDFIPEGEVWVEDGLSKKEDLANAVHEFIEMMVMKYLGWDYISAHTYCACPCEAVIRWAYDREMGGEE
jgi:hypothetical protein